ncbi:hypothetical protein ACWGH5_00090 [Streptomyces sp. NPDC054864]
MQDWDDDTDYHRAVGCTWIVVVLAAACSLTVVALFIATILGLDFFLDVTEALGR